jgi:LysM repeat protein
MEEDIESSGTSMVPLALALLAIVIGGAGLYFGLNANQRIAPLTESVDEGTSSSARVDKQLSTLETRVNELISENRQLKESMQRLGRESSQTLTLAKQTDPGVIQNREEIIKLAQKMSELASSGTRPATRPTSTTSSTGSASDATTPASSGSAAIYLIKSGDTLSKIASLKGVSLDALLTANPDADPRRLSIGQQINIPAN